MLLIFPRLLRIGCRIYNSLKWYYFNLIFIELFDLNQLRDGPWLDRAFGTIPVMRKILTYPFYDFKRKPEQSYLQKQNFSSIGRSPEKWEKKHWEGGRSDTHIPTSSSILTISRKWFNALSRVISQKIENFFLYKSVHLRSSHMLMLAL